MKNNQQIKGVWVGISVWGSALSEYIQVVVGRLKEEIGFEW